MLDLQGITRQFEVETMRLRRVKWHISASSTPESTVERLRRLKGVGVGSHEWVGSPGTATAPQANALAYCRMCRREMRS